MGGVDVEQRGGRGVAGVRERGVEFDSSRVWGVE